MAETPESLRTRDPFIEAAVRPLSDNAELHLAAVGYIGSLKESDAGAGQALGRWDALDVGKRRPIWRVALWVLLGVVSASVWLADSRDLVRCFQWGKWGLGSFLVTLPPPSVREFRDLDARQKLLLFGDLTREHKDERKEGLWRSEPGNPAFFAEYAAVFRSERSDLPPDFIETAKRLEPENAWFTYFAAADAARDSVKAGSRRKKRVEGRTVYSEPKSWEVLDLARLDRSLALFHAARQQSKCESHAPEMLLRRLALLPQDSFAEHLDSISCLSEASVFGSLQLMPVTGAVAAKAWLLGEAGESAGFLELGRDVDAFLWGMAGMEQGTMVDELVFSSCVLRIAESFAPAAEKLGLTDEAARWKRIAEQLREWNGTRQSWSLIVDGKAVAPEKAGGLLGGPVETVAKLVTVHPVLTDADLKPGRMLDHEIFSRCCGYLVWLAMAPLLGLVMLYRFSAPVMVRRLTSRFEDLLLPVDWLWIFAGGVLSPFAFVMAVNRLTPLGGRNFGFAGNSVLLPLPQFLGLWILWWIAPLVVIRWRLSRRACLLGFAKPSWAALVALLSALLFVPVVGWLGISDSPGGHWARWMNQIGLNLDEESRIGPWGWAAAILLVLPVLWLGVVCWRAVFRRARRVFQRVTISQVLARTSAAAMLVMILANVGFKCAERQWFWRNALFRFDPEVPGWSRFEYQIAVQARKELLEILGFTP